jgi:hypothetical protein
MYLSLSLNFGSIVIGKFLKYVFIIIKNVIETKIINEISFRERFLKLISIKFDDNGREESTNFK